MILVPTTAILAMEKAIASAVHLLTEEQLTVLLKDVFLEVVTTNQEEGELATVLKIAPSVFPMRYVQFVRMKTMFCRMDSASTNRIILF